MVANNPSHAGGAGPTPPPAIGFRGLGMGGGGMGGGGGMHGGGHRHTERPKRTRETILRLWGYLRRQRGFLVLSASMVATVVGLDLLGPLLIGRAIDKHIIPRELSGLLTLMFIMLGVYASSATLNLLQNYVMAGTAQRTMRDIRADLFAKLQHLPLRFFDRRIQGELMSRLTSDVEAINQVLSNSVAQLVSGALTTLAVAITMFFINPVLGCISVLTISGLTVAINRGLATRSYARYREQQAALGRLYGFVEETVTGQKVVKAYGQEPAFIASFDAVNGGYREGGIRSQSISGLTGPLMNTASSLALMIVAGVGGVLAIHGRVSVGVIATFINYTRQFGRPLNEVANLYNAFQAALAGAERVFEIIDETPEADTRHGRDLPRIRGEVEFEDVSFAYRPDVPVLKRVSLHAQPGQTIALIGPTGAGKTTIINLLTRFYSVDTGRIRIDGTDLREFPKEDLRRQLGIVLQDTFLFTGTVRDNIRYGRLDATDAEIHEAARLANADLFIRHLERGYDTLLAERGGNLSHGQRQMLAIARAVLADPAILILDEATSSVDTRTEKHIQEAMHRLMRGRTSFVIAHRLSTIRDADQILAIVDGAVVERGTHAELLARQGFYWRLSARPPEPPELPERLGDFNVAPAGPLPAADE